MSSQTYGIGLITFGTVLAYTGVKNLSVKDAIEGKTEGKESSAGRLAGIAIGKSGAGGSTSDDKPSGPVTDIPSPSGITGGAKGIVDRGASIAGKYGCKVISSYRPGSTTTSGSVSDHSENNANRAARDLSNTGNAPEPNPQMDKAAEAIALAFGQKVNGSRPIIKTWNWGAFRLQLIHRTPAYGDHRGHIHFGARRR